MSTSTLQLQEKPTLQDFQKYVSDMVKERGFHQETVAETFMLFVEECGELAKAIREKEKINVAEDAQEKDLAHEFADVFIYLLDLCNQQDIDLEQAFREKEEVNKKRTWK